MAAMVKNITDYYNFLMYDLADQRTNNWPLIASPWPGIALLIFYNYFVLKLGPSIMKNRKPMNLNTLIQVYNLVQVFGCAWIVYQGVANTYFFGGYSFRCQPVDSSRSPIAMKITRYVYVYFSLKIIDLLDTVFFVLRKKDNQITFLHLYHHTGMVALTWGGTKYYPGGHSVFLGFINCFVHVVMYGYYFLSNYNEHYKTVWWKKYITQLQMVQFLLISIHSLSLLFTPYCGFPRWTVALVLPVTSIMFVLFANFYHKAYIVKKSSKQVSQSNGFKRKTSEAENNNDNYERNGYKNKNNHVKSS